MRRWLYTPSEDIAIPTLTELDKDLDASLRLPELLETSTIPYEVLTATTRSGAPSEGATLASSDTQNINNDLHRMLSVHSETSACSPAAEQHSHAQAQARGAEAFRKIGGGACGAVFAQDGKPLVAKLAKGDHLELWNDYIMHAKIADQFQWYSVDEIRTPECYFFVPKERSAYFDQYPGVVEAADSVCNLPTCALVTERILPLPRLTRTRLVERYCPPRIKEKALSDPANRDCLVRVYLGSRQGLAGGAFFSLRNFKLHLNQMLALNLDLGAMARGMAIALAIMHWGAKTDARDVEFVLGTSIEAKPAVHPSKLEDLEPLTYTGPPSNLNDDIFRRSTQLWVLDFNQVRAITMDEDGVTQAVEAVRLNDPYFPKPLRESAAERRIWDTFVVSYLHAAHQILDVEGEVAMDVLTLPRKFIRGIIDLERTRIAKHKARSEAVLAPK